MSLETNDTLQKEQKAAEKHRQHQLALLQQQITNLEERRDQLKNVISQMHSASVSMLYFMYCNYVVTHYVFLHKLHFIHLYTTPCGSGATK